jgi:anti-sigma factor RsiW
VKPGAGAAALRAEVARLEEQRDLLRRALRRSKDEPTPDPITLKEVKSNA